MTVTNKQLLQSVLIGGHYLIRHVNRSGKFDYLYVPAQDGCEEKYNMLRHCGTIYALLELYEFVRSEKILVAVHHAIDYLLDNIVDIGEAPEAASVVVTDDIVKLGGNALAVIALAKYIIVTKDRNYQQLIHRLCNWMLEQQEEDGEFIAHKRRCSTGERIPFNSAYYPGQALYAFCLAYCVDQDERWLERAELGVNYYMQTRREELSQGTHEHDHWLLYAINHLQHLRPKSNYIAFTEFSALAVMNDQHHGEQRAQWQGGYGEPPRCTPTATRIEGLCQAYELLRDYSHLDLSDYLQSINEGIEFELQLQVDHDHARQFPNPSRALGGFYNTFTDHRIRIDYVQHALSSLLGLYRIRRKEQAEIPTS